MLRAFEMQTGAASGVLISGWIAIGANVSAAEVGLSSM
jgi:hypothetical protein